MDSQASETRGEKMTLDIHANVTPELKRVACEAADRQNLSLSELVAKALAQYVRRPDLAAVPRKRPGRPRKPLQPA